MKQRKKKFGPPFDTANWYFKYEAKKDEFPFDEVAAEEVKIKFTPIKLRWLSRRKAGDEELEGKFGFKSYRGGHFGQERWFRPPPKVKIIPGILGPHPAQGTHVGHPGGGERKGIVVTASGHRSPPADVPQADPVEDDPPIPHSISKTLAKFVKHLWRGASQ